MTDQRHVIHPNPGGPTHASSPYDRKLARLLQDVESLLFVAPESDRSELLLVAGMVSRLIQEKE